MHYITFKITFNIKFVFIYVILLHSGITDKKRNIYINIFIYKKNII